MLLARMSFMCKDLSVEREDCEEMKERKDEIHLEVSLLKIFEDNTYLPSNSTSTSTWPNIKHN